MGRWLKPLAKVKIYRALVCEASGSANSPSNRKNCDDMFPGAVCGRGIFMVLLVAFKKNTNGEKKTI